MAKLKVSGSASGTGTITLIAPATSTDRTITLPDESITLAGGVDGIVSTADATAITIDSSENVGIGVVPASDWKSNTTGVQVGTSGSIFARNDSGETKMFISENVKWTASGQSYINNGYASMVQLDAGQQAFSVAPSGTSGNVISWTEALRITNDGRGLSPFTAFAWANIGLDNVAAGNTSPDGSHNISSVTLVSTGTARFNSFCIKFSHE